MSISVIAHLKYATYAGVRNIAGNVGIPAYINARPSNALLSLFSCVQFFSLFQYYKN